MYYLSPSYIIYLFIFCLPVYPYCVSICLYHLSSIYNFSHLSSVYLYHLSVISIFYLSAYYIPISSLVFYHLSTDLSISCIYLPTYLHLLSSIYILFHLSSTYLYHLSIHHLSILSVMFIYLPIILSLLTRDLLFKFKFLLHCLLAV